MSVRVRLRTAVDDCAPFLLRALGAAATQIVYLPPAVRVGAGLPELLVVACAIFNVLEVRRGFTLG